MTGTPITESNQAGEPVQLDRVILRKVTRRIVPILVILNFINYIDRVNIGFAALTMNHDLGLSAAAYGLGAGIFFVGYFIFEVPSNLALRRFGARRWLSRIMLTWGLVSVSMPLAHNEWTFYVLRFLLGAAEAGFFPGVLLYLTYWFPARGRARVMSLFFLSVPLSTVLGAPLSTLVLQYAHIGGIAPWRLMFVLEGIPALLMAVVTFLVLPDQPSQARWLTPVESARLTAALGRGAAEAAGTRGWRAMAGNTRLAALVLVFFSLIYGFYALGFFLSQMIDQLQQRFDLHFDVVDIGLVTAVPYAFAAVAMVLWSRHSDRVGERTLHVAVPLVVGAVAIGVSQYLGSATLIVVAVTVASMGIYAAIPPFWQLPTAVLPAAAVAAGLAVVNSVGNLSGFVGPYVTGWLRDLSGGYAVPMLVVAGFLLLSAVVVLLVRADRSPPGDHGATGAVAAATDIAPGTTT